jgi:hypothetical protein
MIAYIAMKFLFMDAEGSQEPAATSPYPRMDASNPHSPILIV